MVFKLADNRNGASLASRFRRERVRRFARLLDGIMNEVRILDVGGTLHFWLRHREELPAHVSVTVLNLDSSEHPEHPWLRWIHRRLRYWLGRCFAIAPKPGCAACST